MKSDDRNGSSFKSCDQIVTGMEGEMEMEVNEVNWDLGAADDEEVITCAGSRTPPQRSLMAPQGGGRIFA